ncbi:MAG TPA: tol-pal system protein YbgF [Steroidobacteraceae bacterium]|nr:tol-pal system protein YbgF [Steroidobacteraceae bacterium]
MTARASTWGAACLAGLALAGCASTPEEDPVQIKLNDLDTRLARIERVVANQSLLEMANEVAALRSDVRAIHNDVDELNHNLELSRKQTRDLYADLDQRLKNLESRGVAAAGGAAAAVAPGASAAAASPAAAAPDATDTATYQAAFQLLKDSQYDRAIAAFQKFLVSFPDSSLADNAQYWLGEAYYVNKSYLDALAAFKRVAEKYPQSRKLPDALLKVGYCDYELKQWQAANEVLTQVATTFPDTPAGHLAQQRLEKMAAEKH